MISELVNVLTNITEKDRYNHRPKSGGPSVSPGMIMGSVQFGSTFAGPLSDCTNLSMIMAWVWGCSPDTLVQHSL